MDTNETGREPTDAELLRELAHQILRSQAGEDNYTEGEASIQAANDRGREYLRGVRAMPDTPASNADSKGGEE